jgi:hypothetical protein
MSLSAQLAALASRIGAEINRLVRPDHPGLARAWVSFGWNGSDVVVAASYRVAAVQRLAEGRYRVEFAAPFPDAGYCWTASGRSAGATGAIRFVVVRSIDAKTDAHLDLVISTSNNNLADATEVNLVVFR